MVLDTGFVAAVLEGIEATLGELIERVEISELQSSLAGCGKNKFAGVTGPC